MPLLRSALPAAGAAAPLAPTLAPSGERREPGPPLPPRGRSGLWQRPAAPPCSCCCRGSPGPLPPSLPAPSARGRVGAERCSFTCPCPAGLRRPRAPRQPFHVGSASGVAPAPAAGKGKSRGRREAGNSSGAHVECFSNPLQPSLAPGKGLSPSTKFLLHSLVVRYFLQNIGVWLQISNRSPAIKYLLGFKGFYPSSVYDICTKKSFFHTGVLEDRAVHLHICLR